MNIQIRNLNCNAKILEEPFSPSCRSDFCSSSMETQNIYEHSQVRHLHMKEVTVESS